MYLTEKERIEILIMLGCDDKTRSQKKVCELFNNKYPHRQAITQSAVSKIERKWRDTGSVKDRPGKGRHRISDERKLDILLTYQENPHSSTTQVARDNDVHQTTVSKFLKEEKFHPYKLKFVQELMDDDSDRRNEFCEIMTNMCIHDPLLIKRICFTDEATFRLNGEVNKQNYRYWAKENPHWYRESHTQYRQSVNVWAGIVGNKVIGPYFFDGSLTGQMYLEED